jgi:hypothetical protein
MVGALVVASPASAHHTTVSGIAACDPTTGNWIVTWTIWNSEDDISGEITALSKALDGVEVGDQVQADDPEGSGFVQGTEVVSTKSSSLTATMFWSRGQWTKTHSDTDSAIFPDGDCEKDQPVPAAQMASDCLGVTVLLTNTGRLPATFVVAGSGGFSETKTVAVGDQDGETVFVPKANGTGITVQVDGQTVATGDWKDPMNCNTPQAEGASSCTEFIARVINPDDGAASVTGTFKPSTGSPTPFTVRQGETAEQTYTGSDGLSVLVDFDGSFTDTTVTWEPDPEECAPPTTTTPPLADTGTGGLTEIVAAGTALVLAGAGLLTVLFLRRRRTTAAR